MTITLPDELRDDLTRRAKDSGFDSVDSYILSLVLAAEPDAEDLTGMPVPAELTFRTAEELHQKLLEGVNSGPGTRVTPEFWEALRRRGREAAARRAAP